MYRRAFGAEDSGSVWRDETSDQNISTTSIYESQQDSIANKWAESQQDDHPNVKTEDDSDDDFGEFEDASSRPQGNFEPDENVWANESKAETPKKTKSLQQTTVSPKIQSKQPAKPSSATRQDDQENIGRHPFAGRMDLLFEAGDDDYDAGIDELGDLATNPEAAVAYSKRIIAKQEAERARMNGSGPQTEPKSSSNAPTESRNQSAFNQSKPGSTQVHAKDPNVLFDADDLSENEDEDDFDDFEDASESAVNRKGASEMTGPASQTSMPPVDLLGLDEPPHAISHASGDVYSSSIVPEDTGNQKSTGMFSPSAIWVESDANEWEDFDAAPPSHEAFQPDDPPSKLNIVNQPNTTNSSKNQNSLPPTNVPPPAIILSLFPTILAEADETLLNAMSKLDSKQKQTLLSHQASYQFLESYLNSCLVLARIIAGRKLRWKRDQYLAQNTRIGPSAAGGKSGMKLVGVDKSEVTKEDREVVDLLRLWRSQTGKLRTAVAASSSSPSAAKLPPVPEIAENMPVRILKPSEGGLVAPQPCALCGLKREERVAKVDVEVEDSFGEWWRQDLNMHLTCSNFWDRFEKKLKSR